MVIGSTTRVAWFVGLSVATDILVGAFTGEKLSFLYKDELHFSASTTATLLLIVSIPGYLRVFMGVGADVLPFLGYHRRSYYALSWFLMAVAMVALAILPAYSVAAVGALVVVSAAGGNLLFVIMDAVLVRVGNETGTVGRLQAIQQGAGFLVGGTVAGPLGGFVTQHWSYQACFLAAAVSALLGFFLVALIPEHRSPRVPTADQVADRITGRRATTAALRQWAGTGSLWVLIGFIFYLIMTPGTGLARFYFSVDVLHLTKQEIGNLRVPASIGAGIALVAFGVLSSRIPVRALIWAAFAMECLGYLVGFALVSVPTAYLVAFLMGAIGAIGNLAVITLAARACPPRIEATAYGLFVGAITLGGTVSEKIGSAIYDAFGPAHGQSLTYGWHATLWAGLAFTLFAIAFIPFLPRWSKSSESLSTHRAAGPELST